MNKRSNSENTRETKRGNRLNESGETSTLSSSDSMNDIDPLSDQMASESQKISSSHPNLNLNEEHKIEKTAITKSLENIKLDHAEEDKKDD